MKKIILFFLLVEISILQGFVGGCFFAKKNHVHIVSNLPPNSPPLLIHCASKNNDIGNHTLYPGQLLEWSFCANYFPPTTLFFCRFRWGQQNRAFEVYNEEISGRLLYENWWIVKSDGFYFETNSHTLPTVLHNKLHDWTGGMV